MLKISKQTAESLIKGSKGQFFTAIFEKKNHEIRKMNCRKGVHKGLKGEGKNWKTPHPNLVTVYDVQSNGFRNINLDTLSELHINKKIYKVEK